MRLAVLTVALAVLLVPSIASAEFVIANSFSVAPSADPDDGGLGIWGAGYVSDSVYAGGEISIESFDSSDDVGVSYHALVGARANVSPRIAVLADVGAGVTQEFTFQLGLFGSESGFDTERVLPSGAVRVHFLGELGTVNAVRVAIGLSSEARGALDGGTGVGVGLGVYMTR